MAGAVFELKPGDRRFFWIPNVDTGFQAFGPPSTALLDHKQGAGWELEQSGHGQHPSGIPAYARQGFASRLSHCVSHLKRLSSSSYAITILIRAANFLSLILCGELKTPDATRYHRRFITAGKGGEGGEAGRRRRA